ncbi:MAG: TonB-dependent receptor [Steroidobacteraceae bacterium]
MKALKRARADVVAMIAAAGLGIFPLVALRPANADPAGGVASSDAGSGAADAGLEEVVVYARRRSEKLADVPLAETVVSAADIAGQNAITVEDALREVPNTMAFQSARSVSALEVTMRGQTAIPSAIVYDPAVGLYVDGVYVAGGQGALSTMLDIDNIEVVRGAQGTLFGRNNTGGSISVNTRRPSTDAYSAEFSGSAGNEDLIGARAIVNFPISSTFAVRFAYQNNQHEGWGSSVATGQTNFMNQHRNEFRAGALWQPSTDFDAYFTYDRFSANEVGALLHPLPGTIAAEIPGDVVPANFYQTDTGVPGHYDDAVTEAYHLILREHFSDALNAKLILGYRDLLATNNYDADAMAASIADVILSNTSYQKSMELQLSGAALEQRLDWVGGLYWFRDNGSVPSDLAPGLSSPYPTLETNAVENQSTAGFLHGEYHFTRDWSLAAGLRRTEDKRVVEDDSYQQIPVPGGGNFQVCTILDASTGLPLGYPPGGPCPNIDKEVEYGYWSWEASLRHRIDDDVTTYFRSGRAQRSGGWNLPLSSLQDAPYRPETLTDFELGLKARILDGAGAINAAAFTGNYDDMQRLLAKLVDGTPVTVVINAGRARVSGVELEGDAHLSEPVSLQASVGYTDARYLQFTDTFGNNASNNKFYMTPEFQASLAGMLGIPLPDGKLLLRTDFTWRDTVQFNVINDNNASGPVGLLGARAAYTARDEVWELALFGTNLLDKQYAYNGGTILNAAGAAVASWQAAADRRLFGIEFSYRIRAAAR